MTEQTLPEWKSFWEDLQATSWLKGVPIDERVLPLVMALNAIDGVSTSGSCGGHEQPDSGQLPIDQFSVEFFVLRNHRGWKALALLAYICGFSYDPDAHACDLRVEPWIGQEDGWDSLSLEWSLHGYNGADPEEVAMLIYDELVDQPPIQTASAMSPTPAAKTAARQSNR